MHALSGGIIPVSQGPVPFSRASISVEGEEIIYRAPKKDGTTVEFKLTISEATVVGVIKNFFESKFFESKGKEIIPLDFLKTEKKFKKFMTKQCESDSNEIDLVKTLSSIWDKTKACVDAQVQGSQNQELIDKENNFQDLVNQAKEEQKKQDKQVQYFTPNQVLWLINFYNQMKNSGQF